MAVENYGGEFEPRILTVPVGTMVTWNNEDNKDHTVISRNGLFDKRLTAGESFSYAFTQPGSFNYYDLLYGNMDGTVYVVDNP